MASRGRTSWLDISPDSPFSIENIPFGIIQVKDQPPRPATAIGDHALDLAQLHANGAFSEIGDFNEQAHNVLYESTLNAFAALGRPVISRVREYLQELLVEDTKYPQLLKSNEAALSKCFFPLKDVKCHVPMRIGDYTDFCAGVHHAFNCGAIFMGPDYKLDDNYHHLPIAYHGRASSINASGQPIRRPWGQMRGEGGKPVFQKCARLDYELEMAAFICRPSQQGEPIPINDAEDYIFGVVLMNDWSARDVQGWEMPPLGPFNSKNFATTISPWIVTLDALEPFRAVGVEPGNRDTLFSYLRERRPDNGLDIRLEVEIHRDDATTTVARTTSRNLLYSFPQMVAHHTITGCNLEVGDLLASGTNSGTEPGTHGCLLESTQGGKNPVKLSNGETRMFLEDGDTVVLKGMCGTRGSYVGFGDCSGTVLPAIEFSG